MTQTVLPFKLETTTELLTAQSGLSVLLEFIHSIGLTRWINQTFPFPGHSHGYLAKQYILPLLLMLHGGGRSLEDMRVIRDDAALHRLFGWEGVPSSDALGDWLRRQGEAAGEHDIKRLQSQLFRQGLSAMDTKEHTLDIDASLIESWKQDAAFTYKGFKGYDPIVAHVDGWIADSLFRAGNASPAADHVELMHSVLDKMPVHHRIAFFRADSASYQARIFNLCEEENIDYTIGAGMDPSVKSAIEVIPETHWRPYRDGQIAETVHSMEKTEKAFRLIVFRKPVQADLLNVPESLAQRHHVIASNFPGSYSMQQVHQWYSQRGDASENRIKELKIGFGMERMPCGQERANAVFFGIGCLAYNLFVRFKQCLLNHQQQRWQVQTLRWQFYHLAGKVVRHARQITLKVNDQACRWMAALRCRCFNLLRKTDYG